MDEATVRETIREFILEEFLPGEDASAITDDIEMFSSGIMDSIATLKLVAFLELEFEIVIEAQEANVKNLNTIGSIGQLVMTKL